MSLQAYFNNDKYIIFQAVDRVCEKDSIDTCQLNGECVTSVEFCQCPEGYHGFSCEDCSLGYYRRFVKSITVLYIQLRVNV